MKLLQFNMEELRTAHKAFEMAEDLVNDHYKFSSNEWLTSKYDIQTLADLVTNEIIFGPFAQVVKYRGYVGKNVLGSCNYDIYKICVQDHSIIELLKKKPVLGLFYFLLYITTHELVHIVRFIRFKQSFEASLNEVLNEEARVHVQTYNILSVVKSAGINPVFNFYKKWLTHVEK